MLELDNERKYSSTLYRENRKLLMKIAHMKKLIAEDKSLEAWTQRESSLWCEVKGLRAEVEHLRNLLDLNEHSFSDELPESESSPGVQSPHHTESSVCLLTPPRSPRMVRRPTQRDLSTGSLSDTGSVIHPLVGTSDQGIVGDVVDVGPPLSPTDSARQTENYGLSAEDVEADLADKEEIKASFQEVEHDLDDS